MLGHLVSNHPAGTARVQTGGWLRRLLNRLLRR